MPGREHKAVAVGPTRVGGIVAKVPSVEGVGEGGECHWRAGVPRFGLLDRVHSQGAGGVDGQLLHCAVGLGQGVDSGGFVV